MFLLTVLVEAHWQYEKVLMIFPLNFETITVDFDVEGLEI